MFFDDGEQALAFLYTTEIKPFIILSDINVPKMNGMALREKINSDEKLKMKCIPYLFFSTAASSNYVVKAYSLSVQGFFRKAHSLREFEETISIIMQYWERCIAPNEVM